MVIDKVEMLNKLEFMLMGLRQMNLNSVCAWFPDVKREEIIEALRNSPKFKVDDNIVSLKTETEIYEEELQNDILKDLMGDESDDDLFADNSFDDYDDDLELTEDIVIEPKQVDSNDIIHDVQVVEEIQEVHEVEAIHEIEPIIVDEPVEINEVQAVANDTFNEVVDEVFDNSFENKEEVINKVSDKISHKENIKNYGVEVVEDKPVVNLVTNVDALNGANMKYEDLLRLIDEYNSNIDEKLNYSLENRQEVRAKAIKTFYGSKYDVKLKESKIAGTTADVYALINRKKGMEVAYLLICSVLEEGILNYMLDNYDDEVVYFSPIDGVEVEFEVGLNEFYLKDTDMIFDKYLEHFEIVAEVDKKIKKLEVVIGSN